MPCTITPITNLPINLTSNEFSLFDTFLQFGDLATASLIFMGMEEGLDGKSYPGLTGNRVRLYDLAFNSRKHLFCNQIFDNNRVYLNGIDATDGWYINDSSCLAIAQSLCTKSYYAFYYSPTMQMQARLHWLLKGSNRSTNYHKIPKSFATYAYLHSLVSDSAMIDYFPLPNLSVKDFEYRYFTILTNRNSYETYYNSMASNRLRIIKKAYDDYPMKVSVSYTGIKDGKFKLEDFYITLGFKFTRLNTGTVNPRFSRYIVPSKGKRDFLRGERIKENGDIQIAILTPFFGMGQLLKTDIDVISTWI